MTRRWQIFWSYLFANQFAISSVLLNCIMKINVVPLLFWISLFFLNCGFYRDISCCIIGCYSFYFEWQKMAGFEELFACKFRIFQALINLYIFLNCVIKINILSLWISLYILNCGFYKDLVLYYWMLFVLLRAMRRWQVLGLFVLRISLICIKIHVIELYNNHIDHNVS